MAQISGWKPQDWATTYQDGGNEWMQIEGEAQTADGSGGSNNDGAYYGSYGSANSTTVGCGTWADPPPPAPLRYITVGYTEYGDPICVPANDAAADQAPVAPVPVPPEYVVVGYGEYGDPVCALTQGFHGPSPAATVAIPSQPQYTTVGYTEYGDPICAPTQGFQAPPPVTAEAVLAQSGMMVMAHENGVSQTDTSAAVAVTHASDAGIAAAYSATETAAYSGTTTIAGSATDTASASAAVHSATATATATNAATSTVYSTTATTTGATVNGAANAAATVSAAQSAPTASPEQLALVQLLLADPLRTNSAIKSSLIRKASPI